MATEAAPLLPPVAAIDLLDEIIGHLGAANIMAIPSDDHIITAHVKAAYELARVLRRAAS